MCNSRSKHRRLDSCSKVNNHTEHLQLQFMQVRFYSRVDVTSVTSPDVSLFLRHQSTTQHFFLWAFEYCKPQNHHANSFTKFEILWNSTFKYHRMNDLQSHICDLVYQLYIDQLNVSSKMHNKTFDKRRVSFELMIYWTRKQIHDELQQMCEDLVMCQSNLGFTF